jgi:ABC-2 type transport system permease protein
MVFAAPLITLSGHAAPIENMPAFVEHLTRVDPVRYIVVVIASALRALQ